MLVLSRKTSEEIIIDGNIRLVIVEIRGDKVRIGFDAPKTVSVLRKEVAEAIQNEYINQVASGALPDGPSPTDE